MQRIVLDTSALLTFLRNGTGAAKIEQALLRALAKQESILISATTWGELKATLAGQHGEAVASQKTNQLQQITISIQPVDERIADGAATLACRYGVSFIDCIAVSLAAAKRATLLTSQQSLKGMPRVCLITE